MSLHYILPSNTSPETFPKNHASQYSTPLDNPLILDGEWEMACLSVYHNNCINTLNNDHIKVAYADGNLTLCKKATCVPVPWNGESTLKVLIENLNKALPRIIKFKLADSQKDFSYEFQSKDFFIYLGPELAQTLHLTNCLTPYDRFKSNIYSILSVKKLTPSGCFVTLIPKSVKHETIKIKEKHEAITVEKVLKRFKRRVTTFHDYALSLSKAHLILTETKRKDYAIILSEQFHSKSGFPQNGVDPTTQVNRANIYQFGHDSDEEWNVFIYPLTDVQPYQKDMSHTIDLMPQMFTSRHQLCDFISKKVNLADVMFTTTADDKASIEIKVKDVRLELSPDLRDILGFKESIFNGPLQRTGTGKISLTRNINYFYIYSNIGEFVRVGDTEAPLICQFPFNPKSCSVITERFFKQPSYVKVKNAHISQIDIALYDDAGVLVPFHKDAVTTLRLHFRRV